MSARGPLALASCLALLALAVVAGCALGSVEIAPTEVLGWILGDGVDPGHGVIVRELRLPRVVLGALVGAALSLAGAAMQGLFQNPLADPYVLGVASGASLGAAVALVFAGGQGIPAAAFVGALVAALSVYRLGRLGRAMPLATVLLAGVAVGLTLSAGLSLVLLLAEQRAGDVVLWLMGHLGGPGWREVGHVAAITAAGALALTVFARDLDALLFGEDVAAGLGVEVERAKLALLGASALLVAGAVAYCGAIGFVGLVVPHVARMAVGPGHRWLLPVCAVGGAALLVGADTAARTLVAQREIPVGVVTGCVGGPFFLYLLRRGMGRARGA